MDGCQCQSQTSTGSTLWVRQVWPCWESVASESTSTSWGERNVTLYYCCDYEYYDLFSLCSPVLPPPLCFCLPLRVTVWVGVVFRHPTAVRRPHLSLSAQDHPSHSFRQPLRFSSHSTCSPKGLKWLLNKLYSQEVFSGKFNVGKKIHMIVNFTLGLQSPIHMHFCSATQFIADLQCLLEDHLLCYSF